MLGVTSEAVKAYIYQRKLPAIKLGNGNWRIRKTDLEQFPRTIAGRLELYLPVVVETFTKVFTRREN